MTKPGARNYERLCKLLILTVNATLALASARPTNDQSARHTRETSTSTSETANFKSEETTNLPEQRDALVYLQRYGYMQPHAGTSNEHLISEESLSSAISDFQQFAGLPRTGQPDNQTLALMRLPRCGNIDRQPASASAITKLGQLKRRLKRYALQGSKWRRQELTYRISQYPTKFAGGRRHEVEAQIEKAFGIWSQVAPIDFVVKREGRVHIDIRFASGDHGDGDAFDGPGNTLAHAYFPQYGGDAHFDDQEYWTVDSYAGTNIFQVAAHELGHSLGLGHSNVREALMAPFYQKYKPNFKLHLDDVLAIQALYGERVDRQPAPGAGGSISTTASTSSTTSTTTTTTEQPPATQKPLAGRLPPIYKGKRRPALGRGDDESTTPSATAVSSSTTTEHTDGDQPDLSTNGIDDSTSTGVGPADLCADSAIDAITRTEDGSTYVFKGAHYWLLTNEGLARGYPRLISTDWGGLPGHLDAAITWADGKTFFFKGNKYWRFRNRRRDLGYPKLISAGFAGIPDDVDAAFVWSGNGRTYFFKGTEYWRFDSKADPPVSAEYPRPVSVWLGLPGYVSAAFKWENNVTYFFKGNQYYRFNDREFRVESRGRPAFPRSTSEWWFGCVNSNLAQRSMPRAGHARHLAGEQSALVSGINWPTANTIRASLQQAGHERRLDPAVGSGDEWALLASLGESEARPMGTHISDHHDNNQQGAPESEREPTGDQHTHGERPMRTDNEPFDANFVASINKRLAPPAGTPGGDGGIEQASLPGVRVLGAASSATSAIFTLLPLTRAAATEGGRQHPALMIFMCTLIATASTCLMSSGWSCRRPQQHR